MRKCVEITGCDDRWPFNPSCSLRCRSALVLVGYLSGILKQWRSQPDDLVPLCKYSQLTDCESNQFLKKWIMVILWNLHSGTKSSGWLRYCPQVHLITNKSGLRDFVNLKTLLINPSRRAELSSHLNWSLNKSCLSLGFVQHKPLSKESLLLQSPNQVRNVLAVYFMARQHSSCVERNRTKVLITNGDQKGILFLKPSSEMRIKNMHVCTTIK